MEPRPVRLAVRGRTVLKGIIAVLCGLALAAVCTGCQWAGGVPTLTGGVVKDTTWGPLSEPGQQLVIKVRLANLWELPMAEEALTRSQNPKIREISKTIAYQHRYLLEPQVRTVAAQLGIHLPTRPTAQQAAWMADIRSKSGHAYDVTFVKWLRFAHGQIFGLIGQVRGTAQNTVVRSFADAANRFVMLHMQLLESTGLTNHDSFPPPPKYY